MAGQPITRARMAKFDEVGEDAIFDMWLDIQSVRGMMRELGYEEKQLSATIRAFYRWLDSEDGRRQRWEDVLAIGGHEAREKMDEVVAEAEPETANVARLKLDHLKWKAEALNKKAYGKQGGNVSVTINANNAWLGALREAEQIRAQQEQPKQIEEADYSIEEEGDGNV